MRSEASATSILAIGKWLLNGLSIVQGLLLVPLYVHYLGDDVYGYWLATGGIVTWLNFANMTSGSVLGQRAAMAYGAGDFKRLKAYYYHVLCITCMQLVVAVAIGYALREVLPHWLKVPSGYYELIADCFFLSVLALAVDQVASVASSLLVATKRTLVFTVINVGASLIGIITIFVLLKAGYGLWSIPIGAWVKGMLRVLVILSVNLFHLMSIDAVIEFNRSVFYDVARVAPLGMVTRFIQMGVKQADVLILGIVLGPQIVTMLVISRRAADIGEGFLHSLNGALVPMVSRVKGVALADDLSAVIRKVITLFSVACVFVFSLYAVGNEVFILTWMGDGFYLGEVFTGAYAVAIMALLLGNLLNSLIGASGELNKSAFQVIIAEVIRICVLLCGVGLLGVYVSPLCIFVSGIILVVLSVKRLGMLCPRCLSRRFLGWWLFGMCFALLAPTVSGFVELDASWLSLILQVSMGACALLSLMFLLFSSYIKEMLGYLKISRTGTL